MDRFFVRILRGAVIEVVTRWRPLFRALVVPAVLMIGTSYATQYLMQWQYKTYGSIDGVQALGYVQLVLWLLLYALFGMSCHRIILLGEGSLPSRFGIYWTLRETRFLGWVILVGAIYMLMLLPFQLAAAYLGRSIPSNWPLWLFFSWAPLLLATYIDGRVSMVLPATAIEERSSIVESWRLTRGRGLHIAAALFIVAIASDLVGMGTNYLFKELALVGRMLSNAVNFPLIAVAVGIISVTYRELTEE